MYSNIFIPTINIVGKLSHYSPSLNVEGHNQFLYVFPASGLQPYVLWFLEDLFCLSKCHVHMDVYNWGFNILTRSSISFVQPLIFYFLFYIRNKKWVKLRIKKYKLRISNPPKIQQTNQKVSWSIQNTE